MQYKFGGTPKNKDAKDDNIKEIMKGKEAK